MTGSCTRTTSAALTGRSRHGLLTIDAATGPDGVPRIAGHRWDSPEAAAVVREHAGPDAQLAAYDGPERFDIANLLVATDGEVADGEIALDSRVIAPGTIHLGDRVELVATDARPSHVGGWIVGRPYAGV